MPFKEKYSILKRSASIPQNLVNVTLLKPDALKSMMHKHSTHLHHALHFRDVVHQHVLDAALQGDGGGGTATAGALQSKAERSRGCSCCMQMSRQSTVLLQVLRETIVGRGTATAGALQGKAVQA